MNVGLRIPSSVDAEQPGRTFDLRQYLNFAWRNWKFIASVTAFAFLVGIINLVRATPLYTASTEVLLQQHEKTPGSESTNDERSDDDSYMANQLAILRSDSLLRRVVVKEQLAPSAKGAQAGTQNKNDPAAGEQAITGAINRLRGALAISRRGLAQVLGISITWDDPVRAAQLANAVADAYVIDQLDDRLESA
jgi:uncharacterized protein involved in exopolysaccharide biosynthesis